MKAWCVFECEPCEGCLLVFAETKNKARSIAVKNGTWEWEYRYTGARRAKSFDEYYEGISAIDCNADLPKAAPDFYNESVCL